MTAVNRYVQLIERIFHANYREGMREVCFDREDLARTATELHIDLPKNLGDIIYSFRYRTPLPESIRALSAEGEAWIIRPAGRARYCFVAVREQIIAPATMLAEIKVPDATPGVVTKYAMSDEQALLAKLRYNRLIDIFTGVTCYSLQNHLRTTVPGLGQVETDELYVGLDRRGAHYVFPVQAKGGKDKLSIVQIEQDLALCKSKFSALICTPIAAQFMQKELIALFAFEQTPQGIAITVEKHYLLVPPEQVTSTDLDTYRNRPSDS